MVSDKRYEQSTDILTLIGYICVYWAYFELLFSASIWVMLGLQEDTGKIVTGGMDIRARANMAKNLAVHQKRNAELITALKEAKKTVDDWADERNLAVHGWFGLDPQKGEFHAEVPRGKFRGTIQDMPPHRLLNIILAIDGAIEKLEPVLVKFGIIDNTSLMPSPSKHKYQPPTA